APRRSGLLLRTKRANPWHFVPKIVEGRSAAAARNVHGEVREALLPCRSHRFPHYSWSSSAWVYVQSENHPQRGTFFGAGRRGVFKAAGTVERSGRHLQSYEYPRNIIPAGTPPW